jgi:hypothetical protein
MFSVSLSLAQGLKVGKYLLTLCAGYIIIESIRSSDKLMKVSLCLFIFKHTHGLANDSLFVSWITNDFAAMMIFNHIFAFLLGINSGKL